MAVLAVVSVACGDPGSQSEGSGAPVSGEVVVLGAETPIADGFIVPNDAVLLAPPSPSESFYGDDPGWVARLRPLDPVSTFTDLVAQAQAAGFELGSFTVDPCYAVPDERMLSGEEFPVPFEPLPEGIEPSTIDCAATGYRDTDDGIEEITISTERPAANRIERMDSKWILVALVLVGCASLVGCTSEDPVDWAEGACDDFVGEVAGASGVVSFLEVTTVGEMRDMLVDVGVPSPTEWNDLSDDDPIAECLYDLDGTEDESLTTETAICPDGEPSGAPSRRQVVFLVDESGEGVETVTTHTPAC